MTWAGVHLEGLCTRGHTPARLRHLRSTHSSLPSLLCVVGRQRDGRRQGPASLVRLSALLAQLAPVRETRGRSHALPAGLVRLQDKVASPLWTETRPWDPSARSAHGRTPPHTVVPVARFLVSGFHDSSSFRQTRPGPDDSGDGRFRGEFRALGHPSPPRPPGLVWEEENTPESDVSDALEPVFQ